MVTVEINVTKDDIGYGICQDPGNCPVARAAIRAGFDQVYVDGEELSFGYGNRDEDGIYKDGADITLPQTARDFIENFDDDKDVKPFKFRIKLKNSVAKQLKLRKSAIVSA